MRRTLPPSAEIEAQIDQLFAVGVGENPRQSLSELAKLGARLIIQCAVEDEFDAWLGRARYGRRPDCQRGLRNEIELGFKQVKWIKGIEFVAHYSEIGGGHGGYNQDHEFFGYRQSI